MVKIINNTIFNGIAGSRPSEKPKYYIMHNDAGSMSAESYVNWLQSRYDNGQSELGFAHYYITRDAIARVEDTYNGTWSAANYDANMNSLSYEVCQQYNSTDAEFIENENMVLRQMAEDMTYYGDTPNYSNIKFHNEFSSTSCPARSLELHGGYNDSLRDYVIAKIKHYQSLGSTVQEMLEKEGNQEGWKRNSTGWWYVRSDGSYPKEKFEKIDGTWYYFDGSGYMLSDKWKKHSDGKWYYLDPSGAMATGWKKIDGKWYYLLPSGAMATGWALIANKWYYFKETGAMATGWVKYKDHWYYLDAKDGDMKSKQFIKSADGTGWYYLKPDGTMADKPEFTVEPDGLITTK